MDSVAHAQQHVPRMESMQTHDHYMKEFLPLPELYAKYMTLARGYRKKLDDPIPKDERQHQTRFRIKCQVDEAMLQTKMNERKIPYVERFIAEMPTMLAEAVAQEFGPDETWTLKCSMGCNCIEKSGWCGGHLFELDQYFLSSSVYHLPQGMSPCTPPMSPSAYENEM